MSYACPPEAPMHRGRRELELAVSVQATYVFHTSFLNLRTQASLCNSACLALHEFFSAVVSYSGKSKVFRIDFTMSLS